MKFQRLFKYGYVLTTCHTEKLKPKEVSPKLKMVMENEILLKLKKGLYTLFLLTFFVCLSSVGWGQTTVVYETAGTYQWTVPPGVTSITVKLWGGGGGSGGHGTTTGTAGGPGGITTFGLGANLSAGGGGGSAGATNYILTNGGAGGVATGGNVNTNGSPGTAGATGNNTARGGYGGASPNGGATQPGPTITGNNNSVPGINGNAPGGGAAGSARSSSTGGGGGITPYDYTVKALSDTRATGGGGGGAYVEHTLTVTPGEVIPIFVGAGGTAGTGNQAAGGAGANGKIVIAFTAVSCTAPTFTLCPGNITQEADEGACHATVYYTVTATGTPTPSLAYVFTGATTGSGSGTGSGSVFNVGPTVVTITASNDCESNASCSFTVNVTDNQPPVVSADPGISTVACIDAATEPTFVPTAEDNCDGTITGVLVGYVDTPYTITCEGTRVYTYSYSNIAGMPSVSYWTYTYTIEDTEEPVITLLGDAVVNICQGESYTDAGATANDNCNGDITYAIVVTGEVISGTPGTYTLHYNVADECGNATVEVNRTVIVKPNPTLSGINVIPSVVCVGEEVATLTITGLLDGDNTINYELTVNGTTYSFVESVTATGGTFSVLWNLAIPGEYHMKINSITVDGCTTAFTINNEVSWTVFADPAAPTAIKSPNTENVCTGQLLTLTDVIDSGGGTGTCNIEYSHNGAEWTTTLTPFVATVGTNTIAIRKNCDGPGCEISPVNTYSWTVDPATVITGQPSAVAQNLCVSAKATLLSVEATGDGLTYQWYSNTSNSNVNGTLINDATSEGYIPSTTAVGTLYYYVVVSGICGTATSNVSGAVNVEAYPEITIPDDVTTCDSYTLPAIVGTNLTGNEAYYTATGGNGTKYIEGEAITSTVMLYLHDVTANGCWDEENFLITINPSPICLIEGPEGPVCPGASIVYTAPAGLSYAWSITGNGSIPNPSTGQTVTVTAGTTCNSSFTLSLTVTDGNNCSSNCEKTVNVNDTESPVVNATNGSSIIACLSLAVAPTVPTATDNCSGTIEGELESTVDVPNPLTCEGSRVYTYSFTDDCDNVSYWTYTYTIVYEDFTMPDDDGETVACESEATEPTPPEVTDNCGNPITPTGPTMGGTYGGRSTVVCEGTITYTWNYADCEGNNHDWVYTYTIEYLPFPAITPTTATIACVADIVMPTLPTVFDNCGNLLDPVAGTEPTALDCEGDMVYTWTYTDCEGNFQVYTHTVTIEYEDFDMPDNESSEVTCVETATDPGAPEVTDYCGNTLSPTGPVISGTLEEGGCDGTVIYTYTYTDCVENTHDWVYTYTVTKRPTTLTFATENVYTVQYSDKVTLTATLTDDCKTGVDALISGRSVILSIGTQTQTVTTVNGVASYEFTITQEPGTVQAQASFAADCPYDAAATIQHGFSITQEDAIVDYIGTEVQATVSATSGAATVLLMATIRDAIDGFSGAITNACVRFVNTDNNPPTAISGWLTPGLVNPNDPTVGQVSFAWAVNIGNATYAIYSVGIEVGCYYTGDDDVVLTVYKPVGDFITGGGHIIPTQSGGQHASTPGLKTNFGFNVKFNKKGTNLQGGMNIIFRRIVDGVKRDYQIKTNSMTSLGVNITDPDAKRAEFTSKANLTDVTNPLNPIDLGGNLTLRVTMIDRGEPGNMDVIGFTLWNGNELWCSSNWTGMGTEELYLSGGNLVVHSGFSLTPKNIAFDITKPTLTLNEDNLALMVYPNPFTQKLNFRFVPTTNEMARLELFDITGSLIETVFEGQVYEGQEVQLQFSQNLRVTTMLFYRLTIGKEVRTGRVMYQQ